MNFPLRQRWLMSLVVIAAILDLASGDERRKEEGYSGIADKASGEGPQGEIPEQNREKKRKWGDNNMRVWGKREDWEKEESDKRDWSKKNMRAWVKRDATEEEEEEKRSWSNTGLRVWRKRDDEGEEEKRKWGDNEFRVWGNRDSEDEKRARDKNNLRAWGKRDWDKTEEEETAKRTWSNRVSAWGKRSDDDANHDENASVKTEAKMADHSSTEERSAIVKRAIESRVKRSWNSDVAPKGPKKSWRTNVIRVWGKRNVGAFKKPVQYYPPEGPTRTWRTNMMRVWGKRKALYNGDHRKMPTNLE